MAIMRRSPTSGAGVTLRAAMLAIGIAAHALFAGAGVDAIGMTVSDLDRSVEF